MPDERETVVAQVLDFLRDQKGLDEAALKALIGQNSAGANAASKNGNGKVLIGLVACIITLQGLIVAGLASYTNSVRQEMDTRVMATEHSIGERMNALQSRTDDRGGWLKEQVTALDSGWRERIAAVWDRIVTINGHAESLITDHAARESHDGSIKEFAAIREKLNEIETQFRAERRYSEDADNRLNEMLDRLTKGVEAMQTETAGWTRQAGEIHSRHDERLKRLEAAKP